MASDMGYKNVALELRNDSPDLTQVNKPSWCDISKNTHPSMTDIYTIGHETLSP